ncbi:MAG: Periplasmic binding protein [Proteobacteria bacterium]|nr:Periplasmic binding protein [Pseudomonadota bacterium]
MRAFNQLRPALLCALALLLSGTAQAERSLTDMAGRMVKLPDEVHRVYAVGHCIPIVAAVAPEKLANNYRLSETARHYLPPALLAGKAVPAAGMRFSDEEILTMAPDLVVMEAMPGAADRAARLEARLHVPVLLVDQDMLKFKEAFKLLGEALGQREQAALLGDFVKTWLDPLHEKAKSIPEKERVRVYYAEGPNGLSTNPSGSSHSQMLDFVGASNVAQVANLPDEAMSTVSMEQLLLWQPELILVWTPGADQLTTWRAITGAPLWQRLAAVKKGRVVQVPWLPFSWLDRPPGSNRIIGTLWLANLLYPERFKYDMVALTREYFRKFYHFELGAAEARSLLASARPQPGDGK